MRNGIDEPYVTIVCSHKKKLKKYIWYSLVHQHKNFVKYFVARSTHFLSEKCYFLNILCVVKFNENKWNEIVWPSDNFVYVLCFKVCIYSLYIMFKYTHTQNNNAKLAQNRNIFIIRHEKWPNHLINDLYIKWCEYEGWMLTPLYKLDISICDYNDF